MAGRGKDDTLIQAGIAAVIVALLVLCGAALELHWNLSTLSQAYEKNSAQIKAEANQAVNQRCVLLTERDHKECVIKATETAQQKERDEADLYAQRKMAEWAFGVGVTAFISVFLSLVGIFFVWRSLALNRLAIQAAVLANANTLKAIEQDHVNAQKQLRAYLFVESAEINIFEDSISVVPNIKNAGASPARFVFIKLTLKVIISGFNPKPQNFEGIGRQREEGLGVIPTSATAKTMMIGWNNAVDNLPEVLEFRRGCKRHPSILLAANGNVSWVDVFDKKHSLNVSIYSNHFSMVKGPRTDSLKGVATIRHSDPDANAGQ